MIKIKIIILYFIQIRHAEDFPSTGIRLVQFNNEKYILSVIVNSIPNTTQSILNNNEKYSISKYHTNSIQHLLERTLRCS